MTIVEVAPKEFVARFDSPEERDAAIAAFALECVGRPRVCDRCSGPIDGGLWGHLCDRCGKHETTEREIAERIGGRR